MRILDRARAGLQSVSARPGSGYSWHRGSGTSGKDFTAEVGRGYDVPPIYSAINYAITQFSSVEIIHERPSSGGANWDRVANSPIEKLFASPNPWYTLDDLLSGLFISEMAGWKGVSYTFKHRSSGGRVVALEYMPHQAVVPFTAPGSGNFIDYYRLNLGNGQYRQEDPRNVILQRFGPMSNFRPQENIGPLVPLYLPIANIRQVGAFTASMLSNVGAGKLVTPGKQPDGTDIVFGDKQIEQTQQALSQLKGDGVGGFAMIPLGVNIQDLQFSPQELKTDAINNISEEHICAVFLIAPASLYLGTGLENQNNRASAEAAAIASARSFTKPYMKRKGDHLTADLIPELGQPGDRIRFKTEDIEALKADRVLTAEADELEMNYMTINEKRQEKGLKPIEGGNVTLAQMQSRKNASSAISDPNPTSATNGKSKTPANR